MFGFVVWGLLCAVVAFFPLLQFWTAKRQRQLSPQQFQAWFEHNYLGMDRPTAAPYPREPQRQIAGQTLRNRSGTRS